MPLLVRWPGSIPAGSELNGIQWHQDLSTTLAAAAGVPDVADRGSLVPVCVFGKFPGDAVSFPSSVTAEAPDHNDAARRGAPVFANSKQRQFVNIGTGAQFSMTFCPLMTTRPEPLMLILLPEITMLPFFFMLICALPVLNVFSSAASMLTVFGDSVRDLPVSSA